MTNHAILPKLIFDYLPLSLQRVSKSIFQDTHFSVALLPLTSIKQPASEHIQKWLHKEERIQLASFRFEKRYREWLGGRICAKQSLRITLRSKKKTSFIPDHAQVSIQSKENGKPYFPAMNSVQLTFPELSISHSKGYAAALTCHSPCGIDIQFSAENLLKVQERFCSSEEDQLVQQELPLLSILSRLTLLWSAKEAAKKMLSPDGIPGFHELQLLRLTPQNKTDSIFFFSFSKTGSIIPVAAGMMGNDYALALCCTRKPPAGVL